MELSTCCICHRPVADDAPRLGTRAYCAEHYAGVTRSRRSVWRSGGIHILGIVVFAAVVAVLAGQVKPALSGPGLVLAGVVLALVPAALWLAFFYAQDRLEPEPKTYVLGVFVLGALLASAVGIPVVRDLFRVQDWLDHSLVVNLLGSILIVGFVQEFLKYAAVRYSVYLLPEFDERTDGILYGTAAGLGFATMLNIHYVVDSGGVDLGMGVIRIAVTALAQASFAGLTGYFLGRARFEDEPVWWLPLGLTLAAVLNGVFAVARGSVTRTGSALAGQTANPWNSLLLAAVVAGLVFAALLVLVRRSIRLTLAAGPHLPPPGQPLDPGAEGGVFLRTEAS
ncbi:MAG: PrsW family intramembrane metalloprotease [Anaerolineae bacterium]|nr:PrsW family intramembrane metalloprotease [Anaerolineae bacterium]